MAINSNNTLVINPPSLITTMNHLQKNPRGSIWEKILDKVTSNPTGKLKDIYDEALQGSSLEPTPIEGEWGKTFRGEPFLLYFDRQSEVVIFCTDHALSTLKKSKIIFCDGNFRTASEPFMKNFLHSRNCTRIPNSYSMGVFWGQIRAPVRNMSKSEIQKMGGKSERSVSEQNLSKNSTKVFPRKKLFPSYETGTLSSVRIHCLA